MAEHCEPIWKPNWRYGIPFPVFARSSFGSGGAHFCTLSRGVVAIMWLSFVTWQGALGIYTALVTVFGRETMESYPLGSELNLAKLVIMLLYLVAHGMCIYVGPSRLRPFIFLVCPIALFGLGACVVWAARYGSVKESLAAAEEQMPVSIGSKGSLS